MSFARELYQEAILDHYRHPRHWGEAEGETGRMDANNPLCGDCVTVSVRVEEGKIADLAFKGEGCAISLASASMMCDALQGKTIPEALELSEKFRAVATGEAEESDDLGELVALAGVKDHPVRVKCATLPWHTLRGALQQSEGKDGA